MREVEPVSGWRCDRHIHAFDTQRMRATDKPSAPLADVVLRCAGCGKVIARCRACEASYKPGNAANTMRAHLRSTHCLTRAAKGSR